MPELGSDEALWLHRLANGQYCHAGEKLLHRLTEEGFVRVIDRGGAAELRRRQALLNEAASLRERARHIQRPGGLRSLALRLKPRARRIAINSAQRMRRRADEAEREAKKQWLSLSQRELLHIGLDAFVSDPDGRLLAITDPGRSAVREFLHSDAFERDFTSDERVRARAHLCLALRARLLDVGFEPDARVDLAAAILSRDYRDIELFDDINRLAVANNWGSYDRLPIVAHLCHVYAELSADDDGALRSSGLPSTAGAAGPASAGRFEGLWEWFRQGYDTARQHDLPPGYELRLATVAMLSRGVVDDPTCERLWSIAGKLRLAGWSMDSSTYVVAARLMGVRLPATQVVARVRRLFDEFSWGGHAGRSLLGPAASIAADSNLHVLSAKAVGAGLMHQESLCTGLSHRYDDLLRRIDASDHQAPPKAALLALMPGTSAANWDRLASVTEVIGADIPPPNDVPVAMLLLDSVCPEWADMSRFVWEVGSLLEIAEPVSVFNRYARRPL